MTTLAERRRLRNYVYIRDVMVNRFFEQVHHLEGPDKVSNLSVSISFTGPKIDLNQKPKETEPSISEKILRIEKFLADSTDLSHTRPQEIKNNDVETPRFVLETFIARKVVIPCRDSPMLPDVLFLTYGFPIPIQQSTSKKIGFGAEPSFIWWKAGTTQTNITAPFQAALHSNSS